MYNENHPTKGIEMIDALEQMAIDLENAQSRRFKKFKFKDNFWNAEETTIFETIKTFYANSRTYDPNAAR